MDNLLEIKKEFTAIIGKENLSDSQKDISQINLSTYKTHSVISFILKPCNKKEVVSCIKIANKYHLPVYPVSRGMNWGYGSKTPPQDAVIIDMSRLDRILDYNEDLAYVTIEPGITFNQLFLFLKSKKSNLMVEMTGASPHASLLATAVERGIGRGFYPKRSEHICNLEVILPDGKIINTGFGQFLDAKSTPIFKEGIGPDVTGLFLQSNLGIVSKMTIWLAPIAPLLQTLSFYVKNIENLSKTIDRLRILKFNHVIEGSFFFINDYKLVIHKQQYPWKRMKNKTPLSISVLTNLKNKWEIKGIWKGDTVIGSTNETDAKNKKDIIKKTFGDSISDLKFSTTFPGKMFYSLNIDNNTLPSLPTESALPTMYWRKKTPIPDKIDPQKDGCGIIWIGSIVPHSGISVTSVLKIIENIMKKYNYEPGMEINLATERAVYIVSAIIYDREIASEDKNAYSCYEEILSELSKQGIYPYRLTTNSMNFFKPRQDYHWLVKTIKKAVDPYDILAPGRYDFRKFW